MGASASNCELKTWLITGGTGFIGSALFKKLSIDRKNKIIILTRNSHQPIVNEFMKDTKFPGNLSFINTLDNLSDDDRVHCIVNLAGHPIADQRWTQNVKEEIINSRISTTDALINLVARLKTKPDIFLSGSAIGYYGYGNDEILDENSPCQHVFISELCHLWEKKAELVKQYGVRLCIIRTGIVLARNSGMLKQVLPAYRFFVGGPIGDGKQWLSWIHIEDYLDLLFFLIQNNHLTGSFNGTAPNPVRYNVFSEILAKVLRKPNFFRMPKFLIRLLFGEMGEALLLHGQYVIPKRAIEAGFQFKYEHLDYALQNLFKNNLSSD